MPKQQTAAEISFFVELRKLLDEYDVDIVASDDGKPYGQHSPLIAVEFNRPYGRYEMESIGSADECEDDEKFKT